MKEEATKNPAAGVWARYLSPSLFIASVAVVGATALLTYRQRDSLKEMRDAQRIIEAVDAKDKLLYRLDAYEDELAITGSDPRRAALLDEMDKAVVEIVRLSGEQRLTGQVADLPQLWGERTESLRRLRGLVAQGRTAEARRQLMAPENAYRRVAMHDRVAGIVVAEGGRLASRRSERDRQTETAFYLVASVVGLMAVLGIAAAGERTRVARDRRDQTARESAEREKARQVIESLGDGFMALDDARRFTFVNPPAEALLRRRSEELIGHDVFEVYPHLAGSELARLIEQAVLTPDTRASTFLTSSGRSFAFRTHPYQGGIAVHLRDITAERVLQEAAARDHAFIEAVVRDVPYGVLLVDEAGTVGRANPAVVTLHGGTPNSVDNVFLRLDGEAAQFAHWKTLIGDAGSWVGEGLLVRLGGGSPIPVGLAITRVEDGRGEVGYAFVLSDLTASSEARRIVEDSRDAALQLAEAKSEFLANMSHEIRTPLNGVLGLADILAGTSLDDDQSRYLQTLRNSGEILLRVINDVLDVSKIEARKLSIAPSEVDLARAFGETIALFAPAAADKGLAVKLTISERVPAVAYVDAVRLKQIVGNLLSNAVKFSAAGIVEVTVDGARSELRVSVRDKGIGIPADRLDHVFKSFAQGESNHARRFGGTGLGLTISRRLVELMGGRMSAQSAIGVGSVFSFTLPITTPIQIATGTESPPLPRLDGLRVLLAEDNETNVMVARHHLDALGVACDVVPNGNEALDRLAEVKYDAVLMDVHMPVMDGMEATRRWRDLEKGTGRHVPIFALTASALSDDVRSCLEAGMDGVLPKPYTRVQLLKTLAALQP